MEMVKTRLTLFLLLIIGVTASAQEYDWSSVKVDGSRTGCTHFSSTDVKEALGVFLEDGTYVSPNGTVYAPETATARVASIVRDAQPSMARVKTVIAHSDAEMPALKRECELSNWVINVVTRKVEELSGKHIDVCICNFGGIRADMPEGNVTLDDIHSMFPFKNQVVYLEHKGSELVEVFDKMASLDFFQAIGGVEMVVENGKVTKCLIGGQPVEDDRVYNVATISFLLYGGDHVTLAENALNMKIYDELIVDAVLDYIEVLKREGKSITPPSVTYVTIK